jgi:mRNA-degrading endonuclease toxin of MazEF toxin-antitoxin module
MVPRPGEIYLLTEENRPVIVVSREALNRGNYVVLVRLTTQRLEERWNLPNCVPFKEGQFGLDRTCLAQGETISLIEKSNLDLDRGPIGQLSPVALRDVVRAIGNVISAECEPL